MGIVYFYTWLTTRYPLIKQKYDNNTLPIIDHFYLDINGVLYNSSSDNSSLYANLLKEKTLEEMYISILNYLNYLVNHIRPRKTIFIALDGVAPKAKMKDQRNRRFRKTDEQNEENAFLEKILKIEKPQQNLKDSSFSPGTEFMYELTKHIDFFIKRKITEDQHWANLKIVFSNSNVPGEGEHKILDYIREWKKTDDFDINSTHCIYGNDSDLVLLSLVTSLPYIVILREEMEFANFKIHTGCKREEKEQKMELLYINILKEYLELEFRDLFGNKFNLERLVNDFTVFTFFIGNDFLHQTFCMNTRFGNFDAFIDILKKFYKKHQVYLTDDNINWNVFRKLIKHLMKLEGLLIQTTIKDFEHKIMEMEKNELFRTFIEIEKHDDYEEDVKEFDLKDFQKLYLEISSEEDDRIDVNHKSLIEIEKEIIESKLYQKKYQQKKAQHNHKVVFDQNLIKEKPFLKYFNDYYKKLVMARKKLVKISNLISEKKEYKKYFYKTYFGHDGELFTICNLYLKGFDFVFKYYLNGCPSWDFNYPYKLAPLLTDVYFYLLKMSENGRNLNFEFHKSNPTTPFRHLLNIIPLRNFNILPERFKTNILEEKELLPYFEEKFEILPLDQVKDYTWKADLKILDSEMLNKFFDKFDWENLSEYDKNRNGVDNVIYYSKNLNHKILIEPTLPGFSKKEGYVEIIRKSKNTEPDYDLKKLNLTEVKNNIFPTVKIFDCLELKKVKFRERDVYYFQLTEGTIKSHFDKINSLLETNDNMNYPILIYTNSFYDRSLICTGMKKIYDYKEKLNLVKRMLKEYKRNGFFIDDEYLMKMNFFYIFYTEKQLYNTFSLKKEKIELLMKISSSNKVYTFLEILFNKSYPTLNDLRMTMAEGYFQNAICVNLKTGNLLKMTSSENGENTDILKANILKNPIESSNTKEKLVLLTPNILKNDLNLELKQKDILFLLLDTIFIKPAESHTNLVMDGDFQVGLQFMRVIGTPINKWKTVNEFLKLIEKPENDKSSDFDVFYEYQDGKYKKRFNFFMSYHGYIELIDFFQKNQTLIEYFKKEQNLDNLYFFCPRLKRKKLKYIFKAKHMYTNQSFDDTNIEIFNMYAYLLLKGHANYKLRNNFSIIHSKTTISTCISKEVNNVKNFGLKIKEEETDLSFLLKLDIFQKQVYPKFRKEPTLHELGDRIVFINNFDKRINFGTTGTIVGIYDDKIEFLIDDEIFGGESFEGRTQNFRGAYVDFFDVFNITRWNDLLIKQDPLKEELIFWQGEYNWDLLQEQVKMYHKEILDNRRYVTDL